MTRIYTRAGDSGQTGLVGGGRVNKDDLRIHSFGAVDECSCAIGLTRRDLASLTGNQRAQRLDAWLAWTQDMLFNLGSDLATPPGKRSDSMPRIAQRDVEALESAIDAAERDLAPLHTFIHPGGSIAGGHLHLARAFCRRAERAIVTLAASETIEAVVLKYVNRLSDALFVWARWINAELGEPENSWNPKAGPPAG